MMKTVTQNPCPCCSQRPYAACCQPLHGGESAASAEALMRSRYSAYALGLMDYVSQTWHPSTRPEGLQSESSEETRWLGLKVKQHRLHDDAHAEVEFIARYRQGGGRAVRLHETSQFVFEQGRWYYLDGVLHSK